MKHIDEEERLVPGAIQVRRHRTGEVTRTMRSRETTIEHEQTRQDLQYLATLVAFSEDAVIGKTLDGTIEYWNKAAERMYGYAAEEVIGKSVSLIVPPDRIEEFHGFLNKLQQGEHISQFETVRVRKDGTLIDVSLSIAPILDRAGNPIYASTITRNITARKKAQRELIQRTFELDERVKELNCLYAVSRLLSDPEVALDAIFQQTVELILPSWQYPAITCVRIVFRGKTFTTDTFHETPWRQAADIVASGEKVGSVEVVYMKERSFLKEEQNLIEALGRELGNVIERKQAEEALQESEARNKAILKTTIEGIITIDEKGHIESFNPAAERIFGFVAREVIGRNVNMLMPSPYREEHHTYLRRYLETGKKKVIGMGREVIGMRKDGTTFPLELEVSEVHLGPQRLFTGFVRDITERRRLERTILDISEQERQHIGQDLHDGLGSLLTGIAMRAQALAQLLAKGENIHAADLEQIAEWVEEGATHAQALARGLSPVMLETQGLMVALQEVAITVQTLSSIPCTFEGDEALPAVSGTVAAQLYRIAQEAAHNAARHARPQRIEIRLAAEAGNLLLTVRDDGIGYPEDVSSGAGMGHHIMPYRARLIGADFSIRRMPGGGTLASCSLPLELAILPSLSTKDST